MPVVQLRPPTLVVGPTPTIVNLAVDSTTEVGQPIPQGTKRFFVRARGLTALRLAFTYGGTDDAWISIPPGKTYEESGDMGGPISLYLKAELGSDTVEIRWWV